MTTYNSVLAAVDLTDEAADVLTAANRVALEHNATLHIITVIKPLRYAGGGFDAPAMLEVFAGFEADAKVNAEARLKTLAETHDLNWHSIKVLTGKPSQVIKEHASEIGAGLIVVGSHGRHGLGLVLGSTSNGVLHGAPCDILTVRIS